MSVPLYDPDDIDSLGPRSPLLEKIQPYSGPVKEPESLRKKPRKPKKHSPQHQSKRSCARPRDLALLQSFAPNLPHLSQFDPIDYEPSSESDFEAASTMGDLPDDSDTTAMDRLNLSSGDGETASRVQTSGLPYVNQGDKDASALAEAALNHPSMGRNDSAHDEYEPASEEKASQPLRIDTAGANASPRRESISTSPTLWKHVIPIAEGAAETLPAMLPSPNRERDATSPQTEKLPPLRQITGHIKDSSLNELAEAATQRDTRYQPPSHRHTQSLGSVSAQSPVLPYHPYPMAQNAPPSNHHTDIRSPLSTTSGSYYGSPPQYPQTAYLNHRRTSTNAGHKPSFPSLPSAPSSCESQAPANSSHTTPVDPAYSTSHTTPIDPASLPEGAAGHTLPMLPNIAVVNGFMCDYPGCNAPPFQTQYLLSSHRNVHSQTRNHFCQVEGCPRGESGKGFKRKNEMKRHALVHKSPGYTCPFCPDREHKYPRPDNLQRHVRVHHVDKDRNDPLLRDVLAQRHDGMGKTARRRRNTASSE